MEGAIDNWMHGRHEQYCHYACAPVVSEKSIFLIPLEDPGAAAGVEIIASAYGQLFGS
jgi:hypothetical protein